VERSDRLGWNVKIHGLNRTGLDFALALGNAKFAGNVRWAYEPKKRGRTFLVRLTSLDNDGPGVKVYCWSQGGKRRGPSCCWHAHRDFIRAVFSLNPDARVKTAFAMYRDKDNFEQTYERTFPKSHECVCEE
jgi:hypothetical protein